MVRSLSGTPQIGTGLNPAPTRVAISVLASFAGLFGLFELSDPPVGALGVVGRGASSLGFPSSASFLLFSGSDSDSACSDSAFGSFTGFLNAVCFLGSQKSCTACSQKVSTCSASVLKPSSSEIISDSVVLWLTATCFFAKALMGM